MWIVKQGQLYKRGEYIKNWRSRWFQLYSDGRFIGYKEIPSNTTTEPLNNFRIENCQLLKAEKPKPNCFIIRCWNMSGMIERLFHLENRHDRDSWVASIENVAKSLREQEEKNKTNKNVQQKFNSSAKLENFSSAKLEDFTMLKLIGSGTFGKVMLAKHKISDEVYAIKILRKDKILAKNEVTHTLTENRVLQKFHHPFLTELKFSFQTNDHLCFALEYVNGGELFFHLSRERRFNEGRARFYAAEITLALEYLHKANIIYRDLKLENILLDKDGHVKIADFGLCKEQIEYGTTTKTFCGTPEYLAPEMLDDRDYSRSVDWWALGIVTYEMLTGTLPFYSHDQDVLYDLIINGEVRVPSRITNEAQCFVRKLLNKNPSKRLGGSARDAEEVKKHEFFEEINWDALINKKIKPPFKPQIDYPTDTSNFDSIFTDQAAKLTPPDSFNSKDNDCFKNFSYVAPT